ASRNLNHAPVHFSFSIFEDAQAGDFFREVRDVGFGVFLTDTHEHQQAHADLAGDRTIDGHMGSAYSLNNSAHCTRSSTWLLGRSWRNQRFVSGHALPASFAIDIDVCETDSGVELGRCNPIGHAAYIGEVAVNVGMKI